MKFLKFIFFTNHKIEHILYIANMAKLFELTRLPIELATYLWEFISPDDFAKFPVNYVYNIARSYNSNDLMCHLFPVISEYVFRTCVFKEMNIKQIATRSLLIRSLTCHHICEMYENESGEEGEDKEEWTLEMEPLMGIVEGEFLYPEETKSPDVYLCLEYGYNIIKTISKRIFESSHHLLIEKTIINNMFINYDLYPLLIRKLQISEEEMPNFDRWYETCELVAHSKFGHLTIDRIIENYKMFSSLLKITKSVFICYSVDLEHRHLAERDIFYNFPDKYKFQIPMLSRDYPCDRNYEFIMCNSSVNHVLLYYMDENYSYYSDVCNGAVLLVPMLMPKKLKRIYTELLDHPEWLS